MKAVQADNSAKWIVRRAAKTAVAGALCAAGARWAVRAIARRAAGGARVVILSYHRPTPDFGADSRAGLPSMLVSTETLRLQIAQLARQREILSLDEACRRLSREPSRRPPKGEPDAAVITFDDGYVDVYREALPVLRDLRVPAAVYVPTGFVGTARRLLHDRLFSALAELDRRHVHPHEAGLPVEPQRIFDASAGKTSADTLNALIGTVDHERLGEFTTALEHRLGMHETDLPDGTRVLTWDELRALKAGEVDVGGHTVHHAMLANIPRARVEAEVRGCRDDIASHLGDPPRHFAYPNGYYTPTAQRVLAACGFVSAVTTEDVENRCGGDLLSLKRKTVWENSTLGPIRYNSAVAAVYIDNVFGVLGLKKSHSGERPDLDEALVGGAQPAAAQLSPKATEVEQERVAG